MKVVATALLIAATAILAGGCGTTPLKNVADLFRSEGGQKLSEGIGNYEDGNYRDAMKNLRSALDSGLSNAEQAQAHKYLAFIHCVSGRERQCRDEFRRALDADPNFELEPAEAGHPTWGPAFRTVKARR